MKINPPKKIPRRTSKALLTLAFALTIGGPAFAAAAPPAVSLKSGGTITQKNDVQKIGKFCTATRDWIELDGIKNSIAQKKINGAIRREITVGKKLKKSDCVGMEETDSTEFINRTTATGARENALGTETFIDFSGSGRSGTHLKICTVYSLTTGESFGLGKYLTAEGKKLVVGLTCDTVQKDMPDAKQYCRSYDEVQNTLYYAYRYCLTDTGVRVGFGTANLMDSNFDLTSEQMAKAFKLPKSLDLH